MRWLLEQQFKAPSKPVEAFGLTFKNPVGIAAGYDKDGTAIRGLSALGFGHVEIGTVTPKPQAGNPSPRIFRLLEDDAVINRMGFPSRGSEFVQMELNPALRMSLAERILGFDPRIRGFSRLSDAMLGINLGKNKDTPNEEAVLDYLALLQNFAPYADYLTINVSSPNTVGLRELQGRAALESLLKHLHEQRVLEEKRHEKRVPILVKLSPDMTSTELDDAIEAILNAQMDGIIVTNTTLGRDGLKSDLKGESGGLSGSPLTVKSEAVLYQTLKRVNGAVPIVSAGGIMNPEDAKRRLEMGAALVQIYTGLIYRGPGLVREILRHI
ncbi:quinone-dependent dihydroorotate dehydrogenase [Candidatus Villigracilis proximus]|uniref:quinone-dependent dihydroorotate dehydrogenase n=1 Tax=Candidatus Villigracilis proximus TaxID=3140683 RepID=UPI0031EC566A